MGGGGLGGLCCLAMNWANQADTDSAPQALFPCDNKPETCKCSAETHSLVRGDQPRHYLPLKLTGGAAALAPAASQTASGGSLLGMRGVPRWATSFHHRVEVAAAQRLFFSPVPRGRAQLRSS